MADQPKTSVANVAADVALGLIPGVTPFQEWQKGHYAAALGWGAVDLLATVSLIVPVGGELVEGAVASAKVARVAEGVSTVAKAAEVATEGTKVAEAAAPVVERGGVMLGSFPGNLGQKAWQRFAARRATRNAAKVLTTEEKAVQKVEDAFLQRYGFVDAKDLAARGGADMVRELQAARAAASAPFHPAGIMGQITAPIGRASLPVKIAAIAGIGWGLGLALKGTQFDYPEGLAFQGLTIEKGDPRYWVTQNAFMPFIETAWPGAVKRAEAELAQVQVNTPGHSPFAPPPVPASRRSNEGDQLPNTQAAKCRGDLKKFHPELDDAAIEAKYKKICSPALQVSPPR